MVAYLLLNAGVHPRLLLPHLEGLSPRLFRLFKSQRSLSGPGASLGSLSFPTSRPATREPVLYKEYLAAYLVELTQTLGLIFASVEQFS
jgi:hypothetical protein